MLMWLECWTAIKSFALELENNWIHGRDFRLKLKLLRFWNCDIFLRVLRILPKPCPQFGCFLALSSATQMHLIIATSIIIVKRVKFLKGEKRIYVECCFDAMHSQKFWSVSKRLNIGAKTEKSHSATLCDSTNVIIFITKPFEID